MSEPTNDVATAKQDANEKTELWKKFEQYVEDNPKDIFIDYRDELSKEQIDLVLAGKSDEVIMGIEEYANAYMDFDDYYWTEMAQELGVKDYQIKEWLDIGDNALWPGETLDDYEWKKLLRNTSVQVRATVWEAKWDFYNWAYGGPVFYSDVKDSLKILGINPLDFRNSFDKTSVSLGGSHPLKGWFPDMPQRVPAVNLLDIAPQALYDGVMNFCVSNLEDLLEVLESDSKEITFKAGTNVVMYDFGNGAGICEFPLIRDVTIRRQDVEFANDDTTRWGIEECFGFGQRYWEEGGVRNGK